MPLSYGSLHAFSAAALECMGKLCIEFLVRELIFYIFIMVDVLCKLQLFICLGTCEICDW